MEYFLLQLAKTSVICSAAIVLLLLLRPLLRKRFAAKARCRIWLVVALALIFAPFCPGKHAPVQVEAPGEHVMIWTDRAAVMPKITHKSNFVTLDDGTVPALSGVAPGEDLPQSASAAPARRMLDVSAVLFWAWLAGAAVFLFVQIIGYGSFRRLMRRWSGTVTNARYSEILSEEAERLGVAAPKAQLCAAVSTPALTGLFRPTLLLPHENYTESDLRFILRHELTHLKRRDILYKLVLTLANALHWFNPLAYVMLHLADEDIELSCDSAVTLRMEKAERAAYSETLLKAVRSKSAAVPLTTCFGGTVERLKRRLANVLDGRKKSRGGAVLALTVLAVAGLCAAIGFTPAKDASPDRSDAQGEYAGMEEYVLSVIDKLKQPNGYTYSILPEEGSADGLPVEVTEAAADVRVVELEQEGVCMDLAPDGTLELWRFCYEVKPEDKAGALPDRFFWVGGNNITDDGYISDGWYYYLTMLRTDDDPGVYKLLDSSMANDGLWYNGCHYDSAYEYLYDFYADYAKLDVPRYLIPDFLNADDLTGENVATTSADREARRYDGDGWCLYIPTVVWRRTTEAGEDCWYSAYWTGSALRVDKSTDNAETMEAFYRDNGFTLEQYREGAALRGPWYRYDADSGTQFANYLMPIAEGGCYIISTWWMPTDDDSVNEWGYSKKNQIENEAAQLRSMAQSFMVGDFSASFIPSFEADIALALTDGAATLVLTKNGQRTGYNPQNAWNDPDFTQYTYMPWKGKLPSEENTLTLYLSNNDSSKLTFYEGTNLVGYCIGGSNETALYEAKGYFSVVDNDGRTLYDRMLSWYDEAEFGTMRSEVEETVIPNRGQSWEEAAQEYLDAYEGVHLKVREGSQYKFTWMKNLVEPADDMMELKRERGELEENKYYFYSSTEFVPETELALYNAMAGNTADCNDPDAPEGAYAYYRCCMITLKEDGWHGVVGGTGW